ncbi:uncharacterized protein KQ657_004140 [Scheffersomyces spartinae]|uniref:Uncharacterized protein n=1 Tax=Scheffersomyces spartinae TaxID=45513 RepID=A0A9P7VBU7_9ASCO|nr:uncharacterized protein KQ657_004140 [Scheffersomyces spartinae]KAG7195027.1 hypothetical protein KQ657_004140 [Scheffersomyces spartinae]
MDYIDDFDEERILDEIRRVSRDLRLLESKKNPYLHISSNLEALYGINLRSASHTTIISPSNGDVLNVKNENASRHFKKKSSLAYATLDSIFEEDIDEREARSYADNEEDEDEYNECVQLNPTLEAAYQKIPTALESQLWYLLNPPESENNSISDSRSVIMYQRIAGDTDSEDMDTHLDLDTTDMCESPDETKSTPEGSALSNNDTVNTSKDLPETISDKILPENHENESNIPLEHNISSGDFTMDSRTSQVPASPYPLFEFSSKREKPISKIVKEPSSPPSTPKTIILHSSPRKLPRDLRVLQKSYEASVTPFQFSTSKTVIRPSDSSETSSIASLPPPLPPKDANQDFKYLRRARRKSMMLSADSEHKNIDDSKKLEGDKKMGAKNHGRSKLNNEIGSSPSAAEPNTQSENNCISSGNKEIDTIGILTSKSWDSNKENMPEEEVPISDPTAKAMDVDNLNLELEDSDMFMDTTFKSADESANQSKLELLLHDIAQYTKQENFDTSLTKTTLLEGVNGRVTTPINSRIQTLMESLANYVEENENSTHLKRFINDVLTRPPNASKDAINESPIIANCDDSQVMEKLESYTRSEPNPIRVSSAVTPPFPPTSTLSVTNSDSSDHDDDTRHYSYYFDSNGLIPIDLEDYFEFFEPPILTEWDVDVLDGSEVPLVPVTEKEMSKDPSSTTFLTANEIPLDIEKDEEYDLFDCKSDLKRHSDMMFSMGGKSYHGSESSYEFHVNPRASMSNKSYTTRGSGSRRSSKSLSVYYYDKPLPQTPFSDVRLPFGNSLIPNGRSNFGNLDDDVNISLNNLQGVVEYPDTPTSYLNFVSETIMDGVTPSYFEKEEADFFTEFETKDEYLYFSNNEGGNKEPDIAPRAIYDKNINIQLDYCLVNLESVNQFFNLMGRIYSCNRIDLKLLISNEQVVKYILNRLSRLEVYNSIVLLGLFPALMMSNDIMDSADFKNMLQTGLSFTKLPTQLLKLIIANSINLDEAIVFPATLSTFGLHNSKGFNLTKFNNIKNLKKVSITNDPEYENDPLQYPIDGNDGPKLKQRRYYPAKLMYSVTDLALSSNFVVSNDFEKFSYLKSLTLVGLEADIFKTIVFPKSLKSLTLKRCTLSPNLLTRIPSSTKRLKLLYCKFWKQKDPLIGMGLKLRGIEMEKCVFQSLDFLLKISSLTTLAIKSCGVTDINNDSKIKFPPKLRHLDFSHNRIYDLDAAALPSTLVKLNLQGNLLTNIKQLCKIPSLQYLSLTDNKLKHELDLTSLSCLRILYLDGNRYLENISFPKSVEKVNLSRTELVNFPFSSSEYSKIHTVVMNSCQIVRPFLFVPESLVKLHLKNCNILKLSFIADNFDRCQLSYVDLSSNNISCIDMSKFARLNSLNLRDNAIVSKLAIETTTGASIQF